MEARIQQGGQGTAEQAKEKVGEATGQAQEKVSEAADQAGERVRDLGGQARERARSQIDQRSTEAGERVRGTADDLRSVGTELRNQGKEGSANVADQAADRIERAGAYLRDSDSDTLLRDAEDFGRRRPWAVLAGGLVAGIAAARFLKASSRDRYSSRYGGQAASGGTPRAAGSGLHAEEDQATRIPVAAEPAGVR